METIIIVATMKATTKTIMIPIITETGHKKELFTHTFAAKKENFAVEENIL